MYRAACEPQIVAIGDRYVPDVIFAGNRAAVVVVVVNQPAIYGVGSVDILIIVVSCDVQAVIPTVIVQTVISQNIVLRGIYEYAVLQDGVFDGAVSDVDIS